MKNSQLQRALQDIKKAKNLTERITTTTSFFHQAAYNTAKRLYGIRSPAPKHGATIPTETPTLNSEPIYSNEAITQSPELNLLSKELIQLDETLKKLRFDYEQAVTEVDKNAIHFKILRLERQRQEFLSK